ncbi:MAG: vanadium-dependent haloperoxidase [Verrucomicrobia bacterium]|nr:vanadium-dependent haloperoxidase [Verrucomicrobiota bacterium]
MKSHKLVLLMACGVAVASPASGATPSVARVWNERALASIRVDTPHPPAQARNIFSLSACMYDAWAAYDTNGAVGYVYRGKHTAADVAAARREAISYAAYRILLERHFYSKTAATTLAADHAQMTALGYDTNNISRDTSTPAGVGNAIFDAASAWFINDGVRQTNGTQAAPYPDHPAGSGGYVYVNPPLATGRAGIDDGLGNTVSNINRWQRLQVIDAADQNGFPQGPIQNYLGAQWLGVRPFALARTDATRPWIDLGPPPFLNGVGDAEFRSNVVEVIRRSSELTPDDGAVMDISPGAFGNNTLGTSDGTGHTSNPATGLPYAPNVVKRGDFVRVLAEFWADGPSSETPPGHWNVLANGIADSTNFVKRIAGAGPVLDDLEWDVKTYFALNAALHDAACAAWSVKRYYDGWRPISAIRFMGMQGQSSDPGAPSYHTNGLPLITNLVELVTASSVASGRHTNLTVGKVAVLSWPGQPDNAATTYQGVKWIHADTWVPYQRTNFVTPAFPGYISGHSTFSRSAAELLTAITGSPFFPGGMGSYTAVSNSSLAFELGPSQSVRLQWATYYDAADQAGLSRIWGGIHPPVDDFAGRRVGAACGQGVWALVRKYFDGSVTNVPATLSIRSLNTTQSEVRGETLRGFFYQLQSTPDLRQAFTNDPGGFLQAFDSSLARTNDVSGASKFYRLLSRPTP